MAREQLYPHYANWIPRWMRRAAVIASAILLATLIALLAFMPASIAKVALAIIVAIILIVSLMFTGWCLTAAFAFSYEGTRQLSRQIVEGVAAFVSVPEDGMCLDVGCGSGALTIAVAKRNPQARVVGCDLWGKEYDGFSQQLCERNAQAEGVSNVSFEPGDATRLSYPDEMFDAVTSNYVYHNITGHDKQELVLETLRTLKPGGTFAIHDLMSMRRFGDMQAFAQRLRDRGYREVELIDTADGMFMTRAESRRYMLIGSTILRGVK